MKKKFIKKVAAATLSAAVVLSMLPLSGLMDVSAKAPFVRLNTTFKTLTVGQAYKLKLKNNTLGWKVTKVVSKDSAVCTAENKKSYVKLTAKDEGRATVQATLKTAKRKGAGAVKKLSCRVNVKPVEVPDTPAPDIPDTPIIEKERTVSTQAELDAALANANIIKLTLSTLDSETFKIPAGEYTNVDFIVNAPNADVENNATFKSVTIQAIKENTWTEKGKGNSIKVTAQKARVVVDTLAVVKEILHTNTEAGTSLQLDVKGTLDNVLLQSSVEADISVSDTATVSGMICTAANSDIKLDAKGTVGNIALQANVNLAIIGTPKEAITVTVAETANGSKVTSKVPVEVTAKADVTILLQEGAKGSKVEVTVKTVTINIENKTGDTVPLTKPDGATDRVANNTTRNIKPYTGSTSSGYSSGFSGGFSGGYTSGNSGSSSPSKPSAPSTDTTPSDDWKLDASQAAGKANGTITVYTQGDVPGEMTAGGTLIEEVNGERISYGTVKEGTLTITISGLKSSEGTMIKWGTQILENGSFTVDFLKTGDGFPGMHFIAQPFTVVSKDGTVEGETKWLYFKNELNKNKWVSEDGVLTGDDWTITQITEEEFNAAHPTVTQNPDLKLDASEAAGSVDGSIIVYTQGNTPDEMIAGGTLIEEVDGKRISYGVVTEGALTVTISGLKSPEGTVIKWGSQVLENGSFTVDFLKTGDKFPGMHFIAQSFTVVSEDGTVEGETKWLYFKNELNKDKWVSEDGVLTGNDWTITQITEEEFNSYKNG